MKTIELKPETPTVDDLLHAVESEDVVLLRDGAPLARIERFTREDWEDWQYEHSPAAVERGRRAREQYARGEYATLDQVKRDLGLGGNGATENDG